jgi:RND family efflux transporter MFP subunit
MKRNAAEQEERIEQGNVERLRAEIADLKRQLQDQKKLALEASKLEAVPPSKGKLWSIMLLVVIFSGVAFVAGYLPRRQRESVLAAESKNEAQAAPVVNVVAVARSGVRSDLVLPGSMQALTETPVLARASGYVRKRYVDIGDRVTENQLLAEIDAPELEQQVQQAKAAQAQAESVVEQSTAALQQGLANEQLAKVTAARWDNLAKRGVVSRQENDNYQAQYQAQQANVHALEKAVAAAQSNVTAAQANLSRLNELVGYQKVRAPFTGVITLRNIDVGTLITDGSTLLFRIAQINRLRTYVNVPQSDAGSVHTGQTAHLSVTERPGRDFIGTVTRTANALDPSTRTLLTEVQVPNPDGALMPGTYAMVNLSVPRADPPLVIPGDTLVIRPEGPEVAVVDADRKVHFQRIQLGRDYGNKIEVLTGLREGQKIIVNPGDAVRESVIVNPK